MKAKIDLCVAAAIARLQELKREEGQGLVEYALILVLVSVVAIAALTSVGTKITQVFEKIASTI